MDNEITVRLEACEPMELMRYPTECNVWFRNVGIPFGYMWEEVEIRGSKKEVYKFIAANWDAETADAVVFHDGPLAA